MSVVAFDNTMLSALLNPHNKSPVELSRERAESVVFELEKSRSKIILPTPACAELLTAIGPTAQQYIGTISRSRLFEVGNFDARGAVELAILNRGIFSELDQRDKLEPYQKIKVDRQIIAICRVYDVYELYTDDIGLAKRAKMCGIITIGFAEIIIPEKEKQTNLELEPHDTLPEAENEIE